MIVYAFLGPYPYSVSGFRGDGVWDGGGEIFCLMPGLDQLVIGRVVVGLNADG
ncbi:MAG: hypothetical protein GF344_04960 [Chitinivibrionales bacterium]|nr:hypothetical protein [Chitinivibrionales bacterium]MBD3356350.1 hypothetical protein [Chitinivibrionales bacterium]